MDVKKTAIALFNGTWDLIDKADRTLADDAQMLHSAHASYYLWSQVEGCQPVNLARGEWQVSHVYALLGMGAPALLFAKTSMDTIQQNGIGDFDLAFGYEALARAYAVLGDADKAAENKTLGLQACQAIAKTEDKDYAISQFADILG